jgi:DNA/RNA-binding domain of Phe-tRNA-synthetase-like protein
MSAAVPPTPGPGSAGTPPEPQLGWCAREIEEELPGLRLLSCELRVLRRGSLTGSSPPDVQGRLRELSSRFRGARAVGIRREPVPAAYRVFFRHIGLDPDVVRTPIEAAVLERMIRGGFLTGGLLEDVLLIALLDTGVPVWALDAESLDGPLGIRPSREGERLGRSAEASLLPAGRLVVADASDALAILFGELASAHTPAGVGRRVALFAVQVAGVPSLYVEEALWTCRAALEQP